MKKEILLKTARRMAEMTTQEKNLSLAEVCDFGDAVGFAFETKNKYENVYYCIEKKGKGIFTFQPNRDPDRFASRKIITGEFDKVNGETERKKDGEKDAGQADRGRDR